jgi:hypothetical protein
MSVSVFRRGLILGAALLVGMPLSAAAKCPAPPGGGSAPVAIVIDGRQATVTEVDARKGLGDSIQAIHTVGRHHV